MDGKKQVETLEFRAAGDRGVGGRPQQGPRRTPARRAHDDDRLAVFGHGRDVEPDARAAAVIRIDAMWLAAEPTDMRAGVERLLARVVQVFGSAQAHHGYAFGVWYAARLPSLSTGSM